METGVLIICNAMILFIVIIMISNRQRVFAYLRRIIKKRRRIEQMTAKMLSEFVDKNVMVRDAVNGGQFEGKLIAVEENWIKVERTTKKGVISRLINLDSIASIEVKDFR